MTPQPNEPLELFYSYSHQDERLRNELETHLSTLEKERIIKGWHDRRIGPGEDWIGEIDEHLNSAAIILLLVSADFLASNYCSELEAERAKERHRDHEACVIPIILRFCDWRNTLGEFQALPKDGRPVTNWRPRDRAFQNITEGIRKAARDLRNGVMPSPPTPDELTPELYIPEVLTFLSRKDRGDKDIVETLKEELASRGKRLITLWGGGGVGKTAIAAKTGRAVIDDYDRRVLWVSADGLVDFGLHTLLDSVATQLKKHDLRQLPFERKKERLCETLLAAPTLIILDNFDTIAAAEQTRCVEFLNSAKCHALITTRLRLDPVLTRNIQIEVMSHKDADDFLESLIRDANNPSAFTMTHRRRIMAASERNPLVMQWVVGQIDLMQDTDAVLDELARGKGDAAHRVFDRSFELEQLGDDGRATLLALSLFARDASETALAEVAGFGHDLNRLREAVKRLAGLLLVKPIVDGKRYTVEGLTRELTKARFERDNHDEFRRRFGDYFLDYAKAHAHKTSDNYGALKAEKDNLINATLVTLELTDWEKRAKRFVKIFADPERGAWTVHGYWDEAIRLIEQTLEAQRKKRRLGGKSGAKVFARNLARTLLKLGRCAKDQHMVGEACWLGQQSLIVSTDLGDRRAIAEAKRFLESLPCDEVNGAERPDRDDILRIPPRFTITRRLSARR